MQGYDRSSYGDAFADVYDEWYEGISDVPSSVRDLAALAGGGRVLELGVGTGRLAIPLAATGLEVHGVDTSAAMLDRLREKDPDGSVIAHLGDMVDDLPDGPFTLAFVAYNTLFNLTESERQARCVEEVAARLSPGGHFVVEAFVPEDPPRRGSDISVRSLSADRLVLSASLHDPDAQRAEGQFVELTAAGGVRMRPWSIRYATPAQLDEMAAGAGLTLTARWRGFDDHVFDEHSEHHVSVYARPV
ncbi:MAG TPA: class I SAM-dependent methyltransferase [Ilumatobacteraceae bacterium]